MIVTGFELKERLNAESASEVYKAVRKEDNRSVIIKFLPVLDELHPSVVNLRNEFEILNLLSSGYFVKPIKFEKLQDGFALFMDFVPGGSLKDFISKKPMTLSDFFPISIQLAERLSEIHSKKIIHKDLKPENIIFNRDEKQIRIIDFGISTKLNKEETSWSAPNILEGSIHYVSPEQTGRMNRSVDYRSDFYSLGITYYEMLLGKLPFDGDDLLQLVHAHLAKIPTSPKEARSEIPTVLSEIVMKLLAKNAEDRYQTARGLQGDLEKAYALWKEKTDFPSFPLAQTDFSTEFKIPQKLYGRDEYIKTLLDEFKSVATNGRSRMVLIGGYSGVGKSSLVKEINKPLTESKGYFISGKFDQYNRNLPFSAIIQVFSSLVELILTESPERIEAWKSKIKKAIGANGKVVTDVIPELEIIIGKQDPVSELGPQENANRFYIVFQNFIKVFANPEHPLAVFLDDMQWADTASLELLKNLMEDVTVNHLFIILAYRDNEVDSSHPFQVLLDTLEKEGLDPYKIVLQPLALKDVRQLLSDSLYISDDKTVELAEIVHSKTGGNPFFIGELLKQLAKEDSVYFDQGSGKPGEGIWKWDIAKIRNTKISDNVVELLVNRIRKLSPKIQETLELAACIGSSFDLALLTRILETDYKTALSSLQETIAEELIVPIGESYRLAESFEETAANKDKNYQTAKTVTFRFQHDRVQQAAYEIIEEKKKKKIRLQLGRFLIEGADSKQIEDNIFDIANHMNIGSGLITESAEKLKLAQLDLIAGKKAKNSTAYKPALSYIAKARELLFLLPEASQGDDALWNAKYELCYSIFRELGETQYLTGNFDDSQKTIDTLLKYARSPIEKADACNLLIIQYSALGKFDLALPMIIKALQPLGVDIPETDHEKVTGEEIEIVNKALEEKTVDSLLDLPLIQKQEQIMAVNLLISAIPTVYNFALSLFPIVSLKMVNLFLKYGNLSDPYGYSMYAILLTSGFQQYRRGYEFAELAIKVSEKYKNPSGITKAANILANYTTPFVRHLKYSEEINHRGIQASLESGEFLHGGYCAMNDAVNVVLQSKNLELVKPKIDGLLKFTRKVKNNLAIDTVLASALVVSNLRGKTSSQLEFSIDDMSEQNYIELCNSHQSPFPVCLFKIMKARTLLSYGESESALKELEESESMLGFISGQIAVEEHAYLYSLAMAANYKLSTQEQKAKFLERIKKNQQKLKVLAENAPENFEHKFLLVEAELARLEYKNWKAAKTYEQAVQLAGKNEYYNDEALAAELASKFWFSKGSIKIGSQYIAEAYQKYGRWGAIKKQELLKAQFPEFIREKGGRDTFRTTRTIGTLSTRTASATEVYSGQTLDFQSILKSSTAISGEIKLESLLDTLMQISIENVGAEKGVMILRRDGKLFVEAEGSTTDDEIRVLQGIPIQESKNIPISVIYYVERTKEDLVLRNAFADEKFNKDPYIKERKTKSVLCSPIIKQGELIGILYLENNLSEAAFTSDRLQTISILSSQAAISIDNALLYANLESKVAERTKELAQANDDLALKNQHITDSITYSLNIQQAILPSSEVLGSALSDYFVVFRPKDIVSGDFYWFSKQEDTIYIASVDCTGHGVPGALMSMIGNTLLNQIVNEIGITDPGSILEQLHKKVRQALKQDMDQTNSRDGMDLCLLKIEGNNLYFAGAKRPIFIGKGGVLTEIKGDRFSIGGRQKEETRKFTTHSIPLEKGIRTSVYLTTDGFMDQPNPDRQKIGTKGLLNFLSGIEHLSCEEQKERLESFLLAHQNGEAQRDDITLVGVILGGR
ncbi:GAF domain-containing protein [Leptospira selangorensis]|uniref:GAF domain-containing protein n=1 Tax=Leptospira selangorensis TaxID=2484982 RepID=A0A5F2C0W2_9LEPT|nr:AAA family ATPase [Leptospira selangorensis]TGM12192.1 GAF domain-containing protein [Leptospira selangorensis]TGM14765.1 GAF domain-containing protein [Leptospira selangorensis]